MESINVQSDIRDFIEANSTNRLPPYKFDFVPYVSDNELNINNNESLYPKEITNKVKDFISNVFHAEPPSLEVY